MVLVPITGWAVYLSGLVKNTAIISDMDTAVQLFIRSIPYNFYGFLAVVTVGLFASRIIPDFGPMRKAEERAIKTGKVLRDGAIPMMGNDLTELEVTTSSHPNIVVNFLLPVVLIVGANVTTFIIAGRANVLESFMLACFVLGIIMCFQRIDNLRGLMQNVLAGMKGVMPAVAILAFAYCINTVSKEMKTAEYVVGITESWTNPGLLPAVAFTISGFISFATGTSWGTYAIMVPIALPLAYQFSGETINSMVLCSLAAVAGGGVFGDHCSPLSDTTVLSSLGSACDHIDHVKTQLPYTLVVAAVCALPHRFSLDCIVAAIQAKVPLVDLVGEAPEERLTLHNRIVDAGIIIIPGCGVAPGLSNIFIGKGVSLLDQTDEAIIYVGGIPKKKTLPLNYQAVYSLDSVFNAYNRPAAILSNGKEKMVEPLSGLELMRFPASIGELEAFYTDGLASLTLTMKGKIKDHLAEKTLR